MLVAAAVEVEVAGVCCVSVEAVSAADDELTVAVLLSVAAGVVVVVVGAVAAMVLTAGAVVIGVTFVKLGLFKTT